MSTKYAFSKALKELRFHHCQTSDHSNAVRYASYPFRNRLSRLESAKDQLRLTSNFDKVIPYPRVPHDETPQPAHPNHDPRSKRRATKSVCTV